MMNKNVEAWLMRTLKQEIICPFCFESFLPCDVLFRCTRPEPYCSGWEDDYIYAKKSNIPVTKMGRVFGVDRSRDKRIIRFGILRSARCDICFEKCSVRLCPECHFQLSHDVGQMEKRIIAVIGGTGTGKTLYIGSLILMLKRNNKLILDMLEDETQKRWYMDFYIPVFEHRTVPPGTLPARRDSKVKAPLVLRLTSKDGLWKRRVQGLWHKAINTSIFDSAGEDMAEFDQISVENKAIVHADGLIFMIDPLQIESVRQKLPESSSDTTSDPRSQPDNMLWRVIKLFEDSDVVKAGGKIPVPVAFVLSKADILAPIVDKSSMLLKPDTHQGELNLAEVQSVSIEVANFLRTWLTPNFYDKIEETFPAHHYFAVSSLGKQPEGYKELEVLEPLRVEEPFLWLLHQMRFVKGR